VERGQLRERTDRLQYLRRDPRRAVEARAAVYDPVPNGVDAQRQALGDSPLGRFDRRAAAQVIDVPSLKDRLASFPPAGPRHRQQLVPERRAADACHDPVVVVDRVSNLDR
jgi:hypothetical protein